MVMRYDVLFIIQLFSLVLSPYIMVVLKSEIPFTFESCSTMCVLFESADLFICTELDLMD